jgi:hypothetical protein
VSIRYTGRQWENSHEKYCEKIASLGAGEIAEILISNIFCSKAAKAFTSGYTVAFDDDKKLGVTLNDEAVAKAAANPYDFMRINAS